jgi:signal transduction histidine kinase
VTVAQPHIRVLLVEDNPADALLLQEYLSEVSGADFEPHHRECLADALDFLRERVCDVILLDLGLPDSQGLETLTRLQPRASDITVLVLTGNNDEELGLKAVQAGADEYLVKNQIQAPLLGKAIRYAMERRQMGRAVARAEKLQALGTLAGGIAHDFNNILLTVSGNAKLALEELPKEHPAYDKVLEIAKAGSRGAALTQKIWSFSHQQQMNRQVVQIDSAVEEALRRLRTILPARIEIKKNLPANLPAVSGDASQIQQIIMNLGSNAADAIGERCGTLEISASAIHLNGNGSAISTKLPHGDYVKLSVRDTGGGIDKKTMCRVFEPFFTTKAQGRGTGMGLAVVHGIMKNHLGEVTVYSEVGKGTVFNLYFPVAGEASLEIRSAPASPKGQGQRILYVDDEEPLVLLITRTLKRLGYEVSGFTNPVEALHTLQEHPCEFQALVTDLSMPQMSGTDLAQEALQICPSLPVILTSGYIRTQDQEVARQIGIRELILKPDTVEELGNVLHRLLTGDKDRPVSPEALEFPPMRHSQRAGTS